jgi:hypothetical protein
VKILACFLAGGVLLEVAACALTTAQKASGITEGQLFCARATQDGPLIQLVTDAIGVPIIVTGMAAAAVAAVCASIASVPVSPPPTPAVASAAPVVAAPVKVTAAGVVTVPVVK